MEFKDGDVFRWSWNEAEMKRRWEQSNAGTLYWCMSQIAIYSEGRRALVDTFWHMSSEDKVVDPKNVELNYLGNLHDYERARPCQGKYYSEQDILDIRHPNNTGDFYLRKGAKRCEEIIREGIQRKIERLRSEIDSSTREIASLESRLKGDLSEAFY